MHTQLPATELALREPEARPRAALAFGIAAIAIVGMGRATFDLDSGRELDADTIVGAALVTQACVVCLALSAAFAMRGRLRDVFALRRPHASLPRLVVYAGGLLGLSILTKLALVSSGVYAESGLAEIDAAIDPSSGSAAAALVFAAALVPGIAEELLFRGALLGGLAPRVGLGISVMVTALLFAAFHVDPVHVAGAIPLGLYLGTVRAVTGSTLAAGFCHVVNNGLAIALLATPSELASAVGGGVALTGALCLAPSVLWLIRDWPRSDPEPVASPRMDG